MKRIEFLKRLLATFFGAAATTSLQAQGGNLNATVLPTEREKSNRYLLSTTVAGTPYYDFPEVGAQIINSPPDPLSSKERGKASLAEQGVSSPEHPATLKLEPDNAFDFRAIEVYWGAHKMGYIPRRNNKVLYNLMKDGAQLEAKIRLVSSSDHASAWLYREPEDLINIADELDAYDLRIRVYLVSENA